MAGGLLRQRAFRSLWTADLLSQFGDRVSVFAVPLLAAETLGATAFEVSSLRTVQTLAYLVLGLRVACWLCAAGMALAALRLMASPLLRTRGLPDAYPDAAPGSTGV